MVTNANPVGDTAAVFLMILAGLVLGFLVLYGLGMVLCRLADELHRAKGPVPASKAPKAPKVVTPDPTTLTYCQGCGCRHRLEWMKWRDNGQYICTICCREPTPEDVEAKAALTRSVARAYELCRRLEADAAKAAAQRGESDAVRTPLVG